MKRYDRIGTCREQHMTELVLGLLSIVIVVRGFVDEDRNMVILGGVCLAGLLFEVLNKRWGSVR